MAGTNLFLRQTDTLASCSLGDFCADPFGERDRASSFSAGKALEGGTAGTTDYSVTITASSTEHGTYYECLIPVRYEWEGGDFIVRVNLPNVGRFPISNLFLELVYICRISTCVNPQEIGVTNAHSTISQGIKSITVSGSEQTPNRATDAIMIVVVYRNDLGADKSFDVRHSENIDTPFPPFDPMTIGGGWGARRQYCVAGVSG